jgi:hypothetical protein
LLVAVVLALPLVVVVLAGAACRGSRGGEATGLGAARQEAQALTFLPLAVILAAAVAAVLMCLAFLDSW